MAAIIDEETKTKRGSNLPMIKPRICYKYGTMIADNYVTRYHVFTSLQLKPYDKL